MSDADNPCGTCKQTEAVSGEYPCPECGRPTLHDPTSDADWIKEAVAEWGQGRIEVRERSALLKILRQAYAAHLAKLDTSGIAERIVENTWKYQQGGKPYNNDGFRQFITAALAPLLEQQRQMVEVLKSVKGRIRHFAGCPSTHRDELCDCGASESESRIDTILAEYWGGGSSEGSKECRDIARALTELATIRRTMANTEQTIRAKRDVSIVLSHDDMFKATVWEADGGYQVRQATSDSPLAALAALSGEVGHAQRKESTQ